MLACRLVVDGVAFVNATAQAQAHKIAASHTSHVNSARKTASRIVRGRPNRRPRLIDPECRSIRALTKYQSMREFRTLFRRMFPAIQFGGKLPVGDQWQLPFVAHQLDVRLVIVEIYKRLAPDFPEPRFSFRTLPSCVADPPTCELTGRNIKQHVVAIRQPKDPRFDIAIIFAMVHHVRENMSTLTL